MEKVLTFIIIMFISVCEAADMLMKFFYDRFFGGTR